MGVPVNYSSETAQGRINTMEGDVGLPGRQDEAGENGVTVEAGAFARLQANLARIAEAANASSRLQQSVLIEPQHNTPRIGRVDRQLERPLIEHLSGRVMNRRTDSDQENPGTEKQQAELSKRTDKAPQQNGHVHLDHKLTWEFRKGRVPSIIDLTRRHECECDLELSGAEIRLRAMRRFVLAALKGFVIGAGLKGGLALFGILSKLQKKLRIRGQVLSSGGVHTSLELGHAARSTWRYGLFLGSFAGGFTAVDEAIAYIWGHKRTAKWRALVAGALAGPALLLTGSHERHVSMAIYILLRATVLTVRCGLKSARFGWLFTPFGWQYGDAFLMCLSSLQILSAWILHPSTLPFSYVNFLNKHGGKPLAVIESVRDLAHRRTPLDLSAVRRAYAADVSTKNSHVSTGRIRKNLGAALGTITASLRKADISGDGSDVSISGSDVTLDPHMAIPCQMLHPGRACGTHFLRFLAGAYRRALPVYIPVYLVPALVVHRQNLLRRPLPILSKVALGTARSSLFLSCFCAGAWLFTCTIHQTVGSCGPMTLGAGSFPAGLAVLLEKKSRRMELALYSFSRALESFALCLGEWGYVPRGRVPRRLDVALFSLATAVIMHCYAQERDVFRSKYLNVLDFVFGIPGVINSCGASDCPVAKDATSAKEAPSARLADH